MKRPFIVRPPNIMKRWKRTLKIGVHVPCVQLMEEQGLLATGNTNFIIREIRALTPANPLLLQIPTLTLLSGVCWRASASECSIWWDCGASSSVEAGITRADVTDNWKRIRLTLFCEKKHASPVEIFLQNCLLVNQITLTEFTVLPRSARITCARSHVQTIRAVEVSARTRIIRAVIARSGNDNCKYAMNPA